MMKGGKKSTCEAILEEALFALKTRLIREKINKSAKQVFVEVLSQSGPLAIVTTKRRGRQSIQVPKALEDRRRIAIASKWIIEGARTRTDKTMGLRLAQEIFAASTGQGKAVKNQILAHKQVFA